MSLDARNTKHSFANALALARASGFAYDDDEQVKGEIEAAIGAPLVDFHGIHRGEAANCFLASFDQAIVLAFRGTANAQNWVADAQVHLVPYRPGGAIHTGFRDYLDSMFDEITATLAAWSGKGRTLWITGHSLGGALALLAAAYLRFPADAKILSTQIAGVYTFGQPRVGTADFATLCNNDFRSFYFRYVNNLDIVTRVPPRIIGYAHAGGTEYIDATGAIHDDPAWWQVFLDEVQAGVDALQQMQNGTIQIDAIADHNIGEYIALIAAQVPPPAPPRAEG